MSAGPVVGARFVRGVVVALLVVVGSASIVEGIRSRTADRVTRPTVVTVLAASSLANAVDAAVRGFHATRPGVEVRVSYAGSSTLARQIEFGAPADLFLSADRRQADRIVQVGRARGDPVAFAGNRVVVLVRRDADLTTLDDVAGAGVRLVVAAPDVPAGAYASSTLEALGRLHGPEFEAALRARIVSEEPSVRLAVARVEVGAADAAFAYATDALAAPGTRIVEVPEAARPKVAYWMVATTGNVADDDPDAVEGGATRGADAFAAYLASADGRAHLAAAGFEPLPEVLPSLGVEGGP